MTTSSVPPSELGGGLADGEARKVFPCDGCGAPLVFSIGAQRLKCEHCGLERALVFDEGASVHERDLVAALRGQGERRRHSGQYAGTKEVRCDRCGATVVFDGSLTSSSCAYCGGPIQLENAHAREHQLPVDGMLTFRVERRDAQARLQKWVRSRWFAPNAFTDAGVRGRFEGVYLPYYSFDAMTFTRYRGERGDAYTVEVGSGQNKRRERRVRWSPASGKFQRFFDDVCVPAIASLPGPLLDRLEPWPLTTLLPFTDSALVGKRAHTYELELEPGFARAKDRMEGELDRDVRRRIGGDEQRVHHVDTVWSALTYKHVLLPVWLLAYLYAGKSYRVVVNATTGEVSGERPWSVVKIALAVVAAVALAVALYVFFEGRR